MILTPENYYSQEANLTYMSVSQFKDFLKCEARALAKLKGEYQEPVNDCFTIGSYVGASIEGAEALEKFRASNPQIYSSSGKTKGELKSEYKLADKMVETLLADDICRLMLKGDKEVIIAAELFGVLWKAKLDVYAPNDGRIVDLKTAKGIREKYWLDGRWVSFVEYFGYALQMAVYTKLEQISTEREDPLEPLIVAVSKEETPDKAVICFDDQTMQLELLKVQERLPRIIAVKEEIEEPKRCGVCRYCRQTKKAEIIHYSSLLEVI